MRLLERNTISGKRFYIENNNPYTSGEISFDESSYITENQLKKGKWKTKPNIVACVVNLLDNGKK